MVPSGVAGTRETLWTSLSVIGRTDEDSEADAGATADGITKYKIIEFKAHLI